MFGLCKQVQLIIKILKHLLAIHAVKLAELCIFNSWVIKLTLTLPQENSNGKILKMLFQHFSCTITLADYDFR